MISSTSHSAALIYPTATQINISSVIGEKGSLETVPYILSAGYIDKSTPFVSNKQELEMLNVFVNNIKLTIPKKHYQGLSGVTLEKILISYLQHWGPKSTIELSIPFGKQHLCTSHEDGSTNYIKNKKILVFSISGNFIQSNEKQACEH